MASLVEKIIEDFLNKNVRYSDHVATRMFERDISRETISRIIRDGDIIEYYEDDYPCPNLLLLGKVKEKYYHLLVAKCPEKSVVITIYIPDDNNWIDRRKRKK